jgi:hypothetical protein
MLLLTLLTHTYICMSVHMLPYHGTTDTDRLRIAREAVREPDALLPAGSTSDYVAYVPPVDPLASATKSDGTSFGVVRTDALGAKFDLR